MTHTARWEDNPIISPNKEHLWEAEGTFNASVAHHEGTYYAIYRAQSKKMLHTGVEMSLSTLGIAESSDGLQFQNHRQFVMPEYEWEHFGCEDPRVTKFEDKYVIFYTALSTWPPDHKGIKVGAAITKDFKTILEKHPVTPFNAKAMGLFPERVGGKVTAILTANTDLPPSKIAIAQADNLEDFWKPEFWDEWYAKLDNHTISIPKSAQDQIEVGAVPVKTKDGWLLIYCHIQNYYSQSKVFRIDAILLDLNDPTKVLGQTPDPILLPEKEYELYGAVPNVIFPSGALVKDDELYIYYGAADTTTCVARVPLATLMKELFIWGITGGDMGHSKVMMDRADTNPIISPNPSHPWESKFALNPAAIYADNRVHIVYRAMGYDDTSVMGYATSRDGIHIEEQPDQPIYVPREAFERKIQPGNSGCEDPRLTIIGDTVYMFYTAFDGRHPPRVAMTTIALGDFVTKRWNWTTPVLISPPGIDDKDACVMPEKIGDKYVIFHRINPSIWVDFVDSMDFKPDQYLGGHQLFTVRRNLWDSHKIGIGPPPIKTEVGWLLVYHGLSRHDNKYRLGAALLDLHDPMKIIGRLTHPILEPETHYENDGLRPGTVFADGAVVVDGVLYVYYGGADQFVAVAKKPIHEILDAFKKER